MNIKKSLRIIFRNKTYSILNIAGLVIGITAAALIFLWVESKINFNKAIPNSRNLYVAGVHHINKAGEYSTYFSASNLLSPTLNDEFPEVKRNARYNTATFIFVPENTTYSFEEEGAFADSTLFDMIDMKFISGDKSTVFNPAYSMVISESMARKIYGAENPVGKGLLNEGQLYEITGVFKDMPVNTSFQFKWLIPFRVNVEKVKNQLSYDTWGTSWMQLFVELERQADIDPLNKKLKTLAYEKAGEGYDRTYIFLYPLNRMLLYGEFKDGLETGGGYNKTVYLFFAIGILILVIACINFMNLSTARSQKRALEVGIRKTFGTKRKYLIRQFLMEAGLITTISLLISILLIWMCLPFFNDLIQAKLSFNLLRPVILLGLIAIGGFCTLLAGSYPALYLSSFNPVNTIKKQKTTKGGSVTWIRQGLVIFQFAMAFILICTTFIIYLQIKLVQNRDIGIEKDNLVTFDVTKELTASYSAVQNELAATGLVESSGFSSESLVQMNSRFNPWTWHGKDPDEDISITISYISEGLVDAAGIKWIDGTDIDKDQKILINETLARRMGEEGRVGGKIGQRQEDMREIGGIIKDYLFNDFYSKEVVPVIFRHNPGRANYLFVRLKPGVNMFESIARIQTILKNFTPTHNFEPTLMSDRFNNMFEDDRLIEKLSFLFAALAIFISCLGLLGLSAFSAEQRTKEIGVRKVLGAKNADILILLGKAYTVLLLISFVIGIPISLYVGNNYLKDYSYRIVLSVDIFIGVALAITLIALLTVSFQSLRAAIANPVRSIQTE